MVLDGRTSFWGRESFPSEKESGVLQVRMSERRKREKDRGGVAVGLGGGDFFYVPRMVDRARDKKKDQKRNSPWTYEVFFSAGLCTS